MTLSEVNTERISRGNLNIHKHGWTHGMIWKQGPKVLHDAKFLGFAHWDKIGVVCADKWDPGTQNENNSNLPNTLIHQE